jgi:ribosomal protein S14
MAHDARDKGAIVMKAKGFPVRSVYGICRVEFRKVLCMMGFRNIIA